MLNIPITNKEIESLTKLNLTKKENLKLKGTTEN